MKKLIIVGAGGFGREVLQWAKANADHQKEWEIKGFIDENPEALKGKSVDVPHLGSIEKWAPAEDEVFVCAIAAPESKKRVVELLKSRGAVFLSLVHPTALVASTAKLGEGVVICPYTMVSADTEIGDFVMLNINVCVGHDARIGRYSTFNGFCDITGGVIAGEQVFAGTSVKIVPGRQIGDRAFLCAGSVVLTNVKADMKVIGYPAKRVRTPQVK